MYTIGEVSKIVNISANALRYYDEIGLLKPCLTQKNNQYRFYSDVQIEDIIFILELKQYGFSLDEIRHFMKDRSDQKLKAMLEEKRTEMCKEIIRLKERYTLLEKRIAKINGEDTSKMKNSTLLIVDDLALTRLMIRNIVEAYGYTVVGEASNGEQAVLAYEKLKPDLIIMDITMPKMDGIYAATKIREKHENSKIIMCSAMNQSLIILESLKAGAKDYVTKPLSSLRLIHAIELGLEETIDYKLEKTDGMITLMNEKRKEAAYNIHLNQEAIDLFLEKMRNADASIEEIDVYMKDLHVAYTKKEQFSLYGPASINEDLLTFLSEKSEVFSKKLSTFLAESFHRKYRIKSATVENITLGELSTLIDAGSTLGTIHTMDSFHPIHIHVSGSFEEKEEILRKTFNYTAQYLPELLPAFNKNNMIKNLDNLHISKEDYSTVLVSFSVSSSIGEKGFIMLSLPHSFLQELPL